MPNTYTDIEVIHRLQELIKNNQDSEAYELFREYFFQHPLILPDGNDEALAKICIPIAHTLLQARGEWQREVNWWESVISTIETYDRQNSTNLHKGLPYHNRALPLLELNQLNRAVESITLAMQEDMRIFNEDNARTKPAYRLGCFLIPLIRLGIWREGDSSITDEEKKRLIVAFERLFQPSTNISSNQAVSILQRISNERLRNTLLRRYQSIQNPENDPLLVAIYAGSIIEGILTEKLVENVTQSIQSYRRMAVNNPRFIFLYGNLLCERNRLELIDYFAPLEGEQSTKTNRISKRWSFQQKIEVARDLRLFNELNSPAMSILCHLLRSYRNLIHPTNYDTLGIDQQGEVAFQISLQIANMLKTALDIVLSNFHEEFNTISDMNIPTTPSSLASPGVPARFDAAGRLIPSDTSTFSRSHSWQAMGSTTTTPPQIEPSTDNSRD